ncbi:MAG: tetratricopeptide repeat protein, partial [Phycisphaeraceae bacterium]
GGVSRAVRSIVDDDLLRDEERTELRIFHGLFDELTNENRQTPAALLAQYDLHHENLNAADTPALIRAEAAVLRGDMAQAVELLTGRDQPRAQLLLGRAHKGLGQFNHAVQALTPLRTALRAGELSSAEDITAAAEATARLAVLEGRPAADYHFIMNTLDRVSQQVDRLYWPAIVAQARLMLDKDNPQEAVGAIQQALTLNPNSSEAWYLLGRVSIMGFNFDGLTEVVTQLRSIHEHHVLADVLEIESYLAQRDPHAAQEVLDAALERWPNHRHLLASAAAVAALHYDEAATEQALARYADAAGDDPLAYFITGKYLSLARQYEDGTAMLLQAVERQPNWPAPRIELGLLLSQDGREAEALKVLLRVTELDPFNKRANNTVTLLENMTGYEQLETDHFIILYKAGIDAALAHDMPGPLEEIYRDVTDVFQHPPER